MNGRRRGSGHGTADITGVWLDIAAGEEPLDPRAWFAQEGPLELDAGCGKGLFVLQEAAKRPQVNFLGVEWQGMFARFAAARLAQNQLSNARIVSTDLKKLVPRFPDACFTAIHVYFPDPWWKRRHRKRRLMDEFFVAQIVRLLQPDGWLHVATDVYEYFGVMEKLLGRTAGLRFEPWPAPDAPMLVSPSSPAAETAVNATLEGATATTATASELAQAQDTGAYLTHFERKYRQAQRPIFRIRFQRESGLPIMPRVI